MLTVFGTRPEAIKLAPLVAELRRRRGVVSRVCVTGQHREMLDQVLQLFAVVPNYDFDLMRRRQTPGRVSAAVISRIEAVLEKERPHWVVVQGDTTTAAAAALAAFYGGYKVAHVEAGLRSHDKLQPFPEEINRRVATLVADLHFAPTQAARKNLLRESVPPSHILVTGNTIMDALRRIRTIPCDLRALGAGADEWLATTGSQRGAKMILVTTHRRENFGEPLRRICTAVRELAQMYRGLLHVVYPVHPSPWVAGPVQEMLSGVPGVHLLAPVPYLALVHLMKRAHLVLTDSGGIQEEAPALGVPALVLREVTERREGIESGNVRLVGSQAERIVKEASRLLDDPAARQAMARPAQLYGDGHAARRIADALESRAHRRA